jgi:quinol monooxygenase YgiN
MIIAHGDVYAQIPRLAEVRQLMREAQEQARGQPGCISYTFAETLDDPGHLVVIQEWQDQGALEEHYRSRAFADYQAKVKARLVRDSELRISVVEESIRPVASAGGDPQLDD